jgi:CRISPR-associated protein Cmr2
VVDLVLVTIGGVQRFVAESRTTAEVAGGSALIQRLAREAGRTVAERLEALGQDSQLIFPAIATLTSPTTSAGITNKIAFIAPDRRGAEVAKAAVQRAHTAWGDAVREVFDGRVPATPGMPDTAWVCVSGPIATDGDYRALWVRAQEAMTARRRVRLVPDVSLPGVRLCDQSASLPAEPAPQSARTHERREQLSAQGWVKRIAARAPGGESTVMSTPAVASAWWRARLIDAVRGDPDAVSAVADHVATMQTLLRRLGAPLSTGELAGITAPERLRPLIGGLGGWLHPEQWEAQALRREFGADPHLADQGRRATSAIGKIATEVGMPALTPYYAVIVQDLDRLGSALGELDLTAQQQISQQLTDAASAQQALVAGPAHHGMAVYAGGDDLLGFCPAARALPLARAIRAAVDVLHDGPLGSAGKDGGPVTASTAVVFAHMTSPLRDTVRRAHLLIEEAKEATGHGSVCRDALAVLVRRRGGERARCIQPWTNTDGENAADLLLRLTPRSSGPLSSGLPSSGSPLSARLASELERDEPRLDELTGSKPLRDTLRRELTRLTLRHGGDAEHADALWSLARHERSAADRWFQPARPALVGRFLGQECR